MKEYMFDKITLKQDYYEIEYYCKNKVYDSEHRIALTLEEAKEQIDDKFNEHIEYIIAYVYKITYIEGIYKGKKYKHHIKERILCQETNLIK